MGGKEEISGIPRGLCESLPVENYYLKNYPLKTSAPSKTSPSSSFAMPCSTCSLCLPQCHGRGSTSAMSGGPQRWRSEWAPSEHRVLLSERSHLVAIAKPRGHLCLSYSLLLECRTVAEVQACSTLKRTAHLKRLVA